MRASHAMRRIFIALLVAALTSAIPAAQSRRAPTADEAKVLTRFYGALASITGAFGDENWQVRGGTLSTDPAHESIAIHSAVPLDDCIGGDRTWTVRENSPLFNTTLKPIYDRIRTVAEALGDKIRTGQATPADMAEPQRLRQEIKRLSEVTMDVCANAPNVATAALAAGTPSLLSGVAAHKAPPDVCGGDPACYVLVYGDWTTARRSGDRTVFRFVHPGGSPYLENVVIRLHGANDRIQEMLKADWARLAAALGGPTA